MTFIVQSRSRRGVRYVMQHTPEGYAVHVGEGCEGEIFNGPLGCWHSKNHTVLQEDIEDMTTAVQPYQGGAVAEVREFTPSDVETLKQTICKGASDSELKLFIATCQHTGLDPFMRQIYAVQRRTNDNGQWVTSMTIQIGIDGFRLIANRTGEMQGMDGPQWTYDGKTWEDLPRDEGQPLAARCGIWRKGIERAFTAVCRWSAYVQTVSGGAPNAMWKRMGPEMLAKCAEALALRRAFPAEMAALPARPDFIDPDALDMERQEWTAEQNRDHYIAEHPNNVIESGFKPADEAPEVPEPPNAGDNPADDFPPEPEQPATKTPADLRASLARLLTDTNQSLGQGDYLTLFKSLSDFMPDKARFDLKTVPDEQLQACIDHIRAARGEPVGAAP